MLRGLFYIAKVTPFINNHRAEINVSQQGDRPKFPMAFSTFVKWCSIQVKSGHKPNIPFFTFVELICRTKTIFNEIYTWVWSLGHTSCGMSLGVFRFAKISELERDLYGDVIVKNKDILKLKRYLFWYTFHVKMSKTSSHVTRKFYLAID